MANSNLILLANGAKDSMLFIINRRPRWEGEEREEGKSHLVCGDEGSVELIGLR